jgi:hypothetical protein
MICILSNILVKEANIRSKVHNLWVVVIFSFLVMNICLCTMLSLLTCFLSYHIIEI